MRSRTTDKINKNSIIFGPSQHLSALYLFYLGKSHLFGPLVMLLGKRLHSFEERRKVLWIKSEEHNSTNLSCYIVPSRTRHHPSGHQTLEYNFPRSMFLFMAEYCKVMRFRMVGLFSPFKRDFVWDAYLRFSWAGSKEAVRREDRYLEHWSSDVWVIVRKGSVLDPVWGRPAESGRYLVI